LVLKATRTSKGSSMPPTCYARVQVRSCIAYFCFEMIDWNVFEGFQNLYKTISVHCGENWIWLFCSECCIEVVHTCALAICWNASGRIAICDVLVCMIHLSYNIIWCLSVFCRNIVLVIQFSGEPCRWWWRWWLCRMLISCLIQVIRVIC
jgi:hypothetical protein